MRGKSIVALVVVILCFSLFNVGEDSVFGLGASPDIEFAGAGDVEDNSFCRITTLNVLAGGIAITFSGWFLRKRRIL